MANKVYDIITDRIIKQLEAGQIPWSKPWTTALPKNVISGKNYKGINVLMLQGQYKNPYWLTYKQAIDQGGNVRKGERSTPIIYWMIRKSTTKTDTTTGDKVTVSSERDIPILRYYNVFNVEQCDDLPDELYKVNDQIDFIPVDKAEEIIQRYPGQPEIKHEQQRAFYNPARDFINMPVKESFDEIESYYSVLFHEMIHSTGHVSRLNRLTDTAAFGNEDYSKEELIAELGASFLRAETGINADSQMTRSAAYIQSWIRALNHDWGDDSIMQHGGGEFGRFYLGDGYLSYSGGLDTGIKKADLIKTDEMKLGSVWFFKNDYHTAFNGIDYMVDFRVYEVAQ